MVGLLWELVVYLEPDAWLMVVRTYSVPGLEATWAFGRLHIGGHNMQQALELRQLLVEEERKFVVFQS